MNQILDYPYTERLPIDVWPEDEGSTVEFRLVYKGRIPSQQSESAFKAKHEIRVSVHEQLRALWREHPVLQEWSEMENGRTIVDALADNYRRCSGRFLPLVSNKA